MEFNGYKRSFELNNIVNTKNITANYENGTLLLTLPKPSRYERSEGSFTRSFNVEGADAEKTEASLKDGVLKIILPKDEKIKPKRIEIK